MMKQIHSKDMYLPFYNAAFAKPIRENSAGKVLIEVFIKGGKGSGKSWFFAEQIVELSYKNPSMSSVIIGMTYKDHRERGVRLIEDVLNKFGLRKEWSWQNKHSNPTLWRNVNGYRQEIKFITLKDLEQAGWEPPINEATGKAGYFGVIWPDEMAKKEDVSPDSDFDYITKLQDGIALAKNTFVRHMGDNSDNSLYIFHSLNPWGANNPLVEKFHQYLSDDKQKLVEKGYNLAYYEDERSLKIFATTNYLVNPKLSKKARDMIELMKEEPRAETAVYGITGQTNNSTFGEELMMMQSLNNGGNIPNDIDFVPINFSMDVGTASPSAVYLNGVDGRYLVNGLPTRIITKAELVVDPKKDFRPLADRYKSILEHIWNLSRRFPSIKEGIYLFVDGSAVETVELLKAYIQELKHKYGPTFDIEEWLEIKLQDSKWKHSEKRVHRRERFGEMVGSYGLIVDKQECPVFYEMTSKIVSSKTEQQFDHCWDALMYGVMDMQHALFEGIKLKSLKGRETIIDIA